MGKWFKLSVFGVPVVLVGCDPVNSDVNWASQENPRFEVTVHKQTVSGSYIHTVYDKQTGIEYIVIKGSNLKEVPGE